MTKTTTKYFGPKPMTNLDFILHFITNIKFNNLHKILLFEVAFLILIFFLILFVWSHFRKVIHEVSKKYQKNKKKNEKEILHHQ